jgi:hypothetical protein
MQRPFWQLEQVLDLLQSSPSHPAEQMHTPDLQIPWEEHSFGQCKEQVSP